MSRPRAVSVTLLTGGAVCLVAGVFVLLGLGAALVAVGVLLIAAEWLVPGR